MYHLRLQENSNFKLDTSREDFLREWTKRGLVYRGDFTESIKDDCHMCQIHYLRYNLLIFEVDPSRVVGLLHGCVVMSAPQRVSSSYKIIFILSIVHHCCKTYHLQLKLLLMLEGVDGL